MSATPPVRPAPIMRIRADFTRTVENYPELKAGGLFLNLQKQLSDTEQRIALARDYFNQIVTFTIRGWKSSGYLPGESDATENLRH